LEFLISSVSTTWSKRKMGVGQGLLLTRVKLKEGRGGQPAKDSFQPETELVAVMWMMILTRKYGAGGGGKKPPQIWRL
jgi:hypothetical protein